jgi:hypothetical protein
MPEEKEQANEESQVEESKSDDSADDDVDLAGALKEVLGSGEEPADKKGSADDDSEESSDESEEKTDDTETETEGKDDQQPFDFNAFAQTEEGKNQLNQAFKAMLEDVRSREEGESKAKEIEELIQKGDHEALGQRFASEYNQGKQRQEVGQEVLKGFVTNHYRTAFADPVFQNLSADDRTALDPSKAKDDIEYMETVTQFRINKAVEKALADKAPEIQKQAKEAAQKEGTAARVKKAADGSPLPSGDATKTAEPESAADLIREGWEEELEKVGYVASD